MGSIHMEKNKVKESSTIRMDLNMTVHGGTMLAVDTERIIM